MTDEKQKARWRGESFSASTLVLTGVLFLLATVTPRGSSFHIDADPWIGVAIIAIGAAVQAVALWRSAYEDE